MLARWFKAHGAMISFVITAGMISGCATTVPEANVRSVSVATPPVEQRTVLDDPEALRALREAYGAQQVVPLVAARSGSRVAIIVWPVFSGQSTSIASDNAVGTTLDLTPEGRYVVVASGWNPRDRSGRALLAALGASQYQRIGQPEGAPLQELAPRIEALFQQFARNTDAHDQVGAMQTIRAMTQLFAWDVTAFDDVLTEMLWAASTGNYTLHHRNTVMISPTLAELNAVVNYRGREIALRVHAVPRESSATHWVIQNEQSPSIAEQVAQGQPR